MTIESEKEIWGRFLSCNRINDIRNARTAIDCVDDPRNPFQRDCDRITYSYPFRRLQDKTQVIPLPVIDFVHTRLTHTLEVATVGRSLGTLLENHLVRRQVLSANACGSISAILTAACLAHDIGNPPFGHSGEDAISEYFKFGKGADYLRLDFVDFTDPTFPVDLPLDSPSISKFLDLQQFEGNAMGFRLLTKHDGTGLNLTCATLATFTKYPRQSYISGELEGTRWDTERVSQKKYGFFQAERADFEIVAAEVGLRKLKDSETGDYSWARHPLAFLMEAADDICYRIIDLEDGFRIGRIPFSRAEAPLLAIAQKDPRFNGETYAVLSKDKRKFTYLRSLAINTLINSCFETFLHNYEGIIDFSFDRDLIQTGTDQEIKNALDSIKEIVKEYVYKWTNVLSDEAAGFEILGSLLSEYIEASNICLDCPPASRSKRASKIFDLLEEEHQHAPDEERYIRYLKIASYVSGMTDSYAINLFKRIKGISA
jgi:dGTPase